MPDEQLPECPLCHRPIPAGAGSLHHLVPKSRKGRETVLLHRICHRKIHSLFTEKELERSFSTIDLLLDHPELQAFVGWLVGKPPDFYVRTATAKNKPSRGRRRTG